MNHFQIHFTKNIRNSTPHISILLYVVLT